MHHGDHASARLSVGCQQAHHFKLVANIEAGNRLIQKQPSRPFGTNGFPNLRQDTRQLYALLLTEIGRASGRERV